MPTVPELRKLATLYQLPGRSKCKTKSALEEFLRNNGLLH